MKRPFSFTFSIWLVCICFMGKVFIFIYWNPQKLYASRDLIFDDEISFMIQNKEYFPFYIIFRPNWRSSMENHWMRRQNRKSFHYLNQFFCTFIANFLERFSFSFPLFIMKCAWMLRRGRTRGAKVRNKFNQHERIPQKSNTTQYWLCRSSC